MLIMLIFMMMMILMMMLQELQLNILQQTHMMQAGEKAKSSMILQQLQTKQQQLMAQLQLAQHALTLNMLIQTNKNVEQEQTGNRNNNPEPPRDRHRSETQYSSDGSTKENQNNNNSSPLIHAPGKINGNRSSSSEETSPSFKSEISQEAEKENLLYSGGLCRWPGCERECSSSSHWRLHMSQEHGLSDKTTAQARVQMQIVTQLEVQLKKEKVRLAAMMKHLHPKQSSIKDDLQSPEPKRFRAESPSPPPPQLSLSNLPKMTVPEMLKNSPGHMGNPYTNPLAHLMSLQPSVSASISPLAALNTTASHHSPTSASTPLRGTIHDKTSSNLPSYTHLSGGGSMTPDSHRRRVTHHDRGNPNLDPEEDLSKNREFYRVQDVRPPYTYAALIRQVKHRHLPKLLNATEI